MDTPNSAEAIRTPSVVGALPALQTGEIAAAIRALLAGETIKDAGDRRHIEEALAFVNAPTQDLSDIERHASSVGEVCGGYFMQGAEPPPEVDALNKHCQMLLCWHYLSDAEAQLAQVPRDPAKIAYSVGFAMDIATTVSKQYHDDSLLKEARALQEKVEQR